MNTTIDQMLTNIYELEGLLLVMQRHNDNVPQLVIDKFKEKAQQIAAAASVLDSLKKPEEKLATAAPLQPEPTPSLEPEKPVATPPLQPEHPVVAPPLQSEQPAVPPLQPPIFAPSAPPTAAPVAPPAPPASEPVIEPDPDPIIEPVPDTALDYDPEPICDTKPIESSEEPFAPDSPTTRDITSAFSINDRFLFQRELFDGNKQRYADAITVMQRLGDIDRIKEFMTDILGLDLNNEHVKEFVRLVELGLKG